MGSNSFAFKEWAANEGLTSSTSVETLKGRRIGIDAQDYLDYLLVNGFPEPLLPAHGGLPFTLKDRVDKDLQGFQDSGIEPVFVFNGLDLACKDRASILKEGRKANEILNNAWATYDKGQGEDAVLMFGKACTYRSYHIVRSLQVFLHRRGISIQIAPYAAASQLAYMEREGYVAAVKGSASCLVYGAERVIVIFDWEKINFTWIALNDCLLKLDLSRERFIHVLLLSGCSILAPLPEVEDVAPAGRIQAVRNNMSRSNNSADTVCQNSADPSYHALFHKARFALKHPIILAGDGTLEQMHKDSSPGDLHEVIGQRLPDEIFHYLSRGVVGPRLLNWRTRAEIVETPPLDGGNSQTYKDMVQDKLRPLRFQALFLMTKSLHRYYAFSDVNLVCWWSDGNKTALDLAERFKQSDLSDQLVPANSWHVKHGQMPQLNGVDAATSPLTYAILSLSKVSDAKNTVTPRPDLSEAFTDVNVIRANTVWRFLQDREYINTDHTLSSRGRILQAAFEMAQTHKLKSEASRSEMEEAILLAFELIRLDTLSTRQMFPATAYSGAPLRGSEIDKANTLLVSRIACLATFTHKPIGYTGPLSRHLLAYHQTAAAVRDALRDLLEMHSCHMLFSAAVDRNLDAAKYTDLGASLPLLNEPDLGLALVVKSHLDELSNEPGKRQDVHNWFNFAEDIEGDLEKTWKIWDAVNAGVQAADNSIINADTQSMFRDADEWLKHKRDIANAPNGSD